MSSSILPLRISVSTHGFGPCGGSSILSGVTKMVIWSSGLGAGLQTQLGGFDSYYHLNGFGGNPRIDDESMSTKMPRGQVTGDGSYLFLEWLDTISRYEQHSVYMFEGGRNLNIYLPRWRNGSVFVLHTNGGGSIPSRGTKIGMQKSFGYGNLTVNQVLLGVVRVHYCPL